MAILNGIEKDIDNVLHSVCEVLTTNDNLTVIESDLLTQSIAHLGSARTLIKSAKISYKGSFGGSSK
jgi:hypothetical protein